MRSLLTLLISLHLFSSMLNHPPDIQGAQQIGPAHSDTSTVDTSLFALDSTILKFIRLSPRDVSFHLNRGRELFHANQLDSAEIAAKIALALCDTMPEIYNLLGMIELKQADHRIIPVERILRLLKKDHKSKAIRYLKKAIDINPDYIDAHYNLGCVYLSKGGSKDLERAENKFKFILSKLHRYKDTIYQLGRVHQMRQEFPLAIEIFKQLGASRQSDGREFIQLATIYYQINEDELASRSYYQGLEKLTDDEMLQEMYDSIEILLTEAEKNEYQNLSKPNQAFFFKKFWKSRDPSPGTLTNERLLEHFRRIEFAKHNFSKTVPPFYDDRGKIYIKYGMPGDRYTSTVDHTFAKPNESWSYENIQEGLVFDFVEEGGVFRLVDDLKEAALPGVGYDYQLLIAGQLYDQRSHLSKTYSKLAMGVDESRLLQFQTARLNALSAVSPEMYIPDVNAERLPFISKCSQFKGQGDSTQFFFYFSLPSRAFNFVNVKDEERFKSNLDYTLLVLDSLFNEFYTYSLSTPLFMPTLKNIEFGNFILQNSFTALPGNYQLHFKVQTDSPRRIGLQRETIPIKNYQTNKLMLSDLMLASSIESADTQKSNQFIRNDLKLIPHPFYTVMQKKPIHLYYEIYNLKINAEGNVNYQIEYSAQSKKTNPSFMKKALSLFGRLFSGKTTAVITSTYTRTGTSQQATEYLAFNFENLEQGITQLAVKIDDLNSKESVVDTLEFNLVN